MSYIPAFNLIKQKLTIVSVKGQLKINNSYDEFLDIVKLLLRGVEVDEKWYLKEYPDVADAVAAGVMKSAKQHFIDLGYFEGRRPAAFAIDEEFYLRQYPDVADGIKRGDIVSAQQHFEEHGYAEGRLPMAY